MILDKKYFVTIFYPVFPYFLIYSYYLIYYLLLIYSFDYYFDQYPLVLILTLFHQYLIHN
uniref:Uncharacterized protein n=1 Tax=Schistosoma curassoni TaxID=6186 RepID=A0A183KH10_9TREM